MVCLADCSPQYQWSEWGACSVVCGPGRRRRTNLFQPDMETCKGKQEETQSCNEKPCTSAADSDGINTDISKILWGRHLGGGNFNQY